MNFHLYLKFQGHWVFIYAGTLKDCIHAQRDTEERSGHSKLNFRIYKMPQQAVA